MGWTWYQATHYRNGGIDRKAECDAYFAGSNANYYVVEKSSMVGSVYYAAVRIIGQFNYNDNTLIQIPREEQIVFAAIFLTQTDTREYLDFGYKDMDETMLPFFYDCPTGILKLLTPTDNENANEWRKKCWETAAKKKADRDDPNNLNNLPVGTVIMCEGRKVIKTAPRAQFKTPFWKVCDRNTYLKKGDIKRCGYEVISRPPTV